MTIVIHVKDRYAKGAKILYENVSPEDRGEDERYEGLYSVKTIKKGKEVVIRYPLTEIYSIREYKDDGEIDIRET